MIGPELKIDVLLCTFRRPEVRETLRSLDVLDLPEGVNLRIVVSDNDDSPSAKTVVEETAATMTRPVLYCHAPARNISVARNAGLDAAAKREADWVAFLDDDETAEPDWLAELLDCAKTTSADAVFGPSIAEYGPDAPDWMRQEDYHSNWPERRGSVVQTGHTCNALLRLGHAPWRAERFDIARGRTGGEDTEFFFRLNHQGARFEISETAIVREGVPPSRLSFRWIAQRKYRSGQSYAAITQGAASRLKLILSSGAKVLACTCGALINFWSEERRNFWLLRGALHIGVISGCLSLRQPEIYGASST
jgi:succinoglycan biosynthesis protein ExoM